MKSFDEILLNRRQVLALGLGATATFGLAACGGGEAAQTAPESETELKDEQEAPAINAGEFDKLIASGPVAAEEVVAASEWASSVKKAGKLRVGGVETSTFFSLRDVDDGHYRGFDAGLFQLLARYITGSEANFELSKVTSDTRESVLENNTVDAVFATYSYTADRAKRIDFAGPYYTSQQSILVTKDNADINGLDDLAGKNVAVQSGSTGPTIMKDLAPEANLQQFTTDEEARLALEQKRVDAYVIDNTMQMGAVAKNPNKYKIVGDVFGPIDPYGIGLPKGAKGAVEFVNDFLTAVEQPADASASLWESLWLLSIGDRIGATEAPKAPAIGVFE